MRESYELIVGRTFSRWNGVQAGKRIFNFRLGALQIVLRRFAAGGQTQVLAAAFAIFGFADVPIVYMSIRWFRTQHPSPVMGGGQNSGLDPAMAHVFLTNLAAFTLMGIVFLVLRYKLQMQEHALESAHAQAALKGVA